MLRREEHLRNVVACLKILNTSLSSTNALLRQEYESNLGSLSSVEARTKVLAALDAQTAHGDKLSQSTNIVRYEAEQFRVSDLWHAANVSRQQVFGLRHKVFGVGGGRRLAPGAHGAHGRFNRLQKSIGGEERLVDSFGRTEEEVMEEESLIQDLPSKDARRFIDTIVDGDAEHSSIRPIWLLRFFVGWGARWSARAARNTAASATSASAPDEQKEEATSRDIAMNNSGRSTPSIVISNVEDEESRKTR
ncbi:hypothetical protein FA15DRAFT_583568 [Coprinopsis marcescibilis]|uniref:Uncharacterized protein n=1 Tax=Coprinopsis marcescibilis TaxID=230819 RepID=A0A5C3L9N6_COPMA|nr:hypothetical protein FA15DRAFT_583568 [Coprinopsis marcescibilis]